MLKVGLTGGMASGKNFVAALFEKKGWYAIDADELSRRVMTVGGAAFERIAADFPCVIHDGEISRGELRSIVTADPVQRRLLESIVHPAVQAEADIETKAIVRKNSNAVILHHAPLLIESGMHLKMDFTILLWCEPETQLRRLKMRGYPPYDEAVKLLASQMPYEEKLKYARHVINNNGSERETAQEVDRVFNLINMSLYGQKHI